VGLADDLGVKLNGGRVGAREGPTALRAALANYGVAEPYGWEWPGVFDAGDVVPAEGDDEAALRETHRRVTEATSALLEMGLFPIGIGGGHDLTFPFVRAVAKRHKKLAGVYFDAHLDVREEAGSGMPFRRLIEECGVGPLEVHGLDPFANSRRHWEWFVAHGGTVMEDFVDEPAADSDRFVSFDMDVLSSSEAPGVSAVNPSGWSVSNAAYWVSQLASDPRTRCFDIMELNPALDVDGRTARVAAFLLLEFLSGFAERDS
jgi:formiminoglutamase